MFQEPFVFFTVCVPLISFVHLIVGLLRL
jgi:hypothetical protein